jgi:peptide chain release factor 2
MNLDHLKIELAYPRQPGGQQVGLTPPDIKVTHLPTGNVVIVGSERSQKQNRDLAISMIEWMIANMKP